MDYKIVKLNEIADFNKESMGKNSNYEFINYLDTANITNGTIDTIVRMSVEEAPSRAKRIVHNNDIVYSTVRPNLCHYGIIDFPAENMIVSTGFTVISCKGGINPYYVYNYLTQNDITSQLHSIAENSTSAYPSIKPSDLESIEIKIPRLEIQNKIAKILTDIDRKMKLNNEINNNLYDLGKSYFEDFISNCDREVAIKDIADEVLDYTKNKNDKVKLLNSSDVTENIFPKVEFVDNKDLKGHFKKRFKKHDILYSQIRPRNHHYGYVLLDDSENYLASTRFMVVRNKKEKVSSSLLYYYLTSKNAVEDFTTKTELRSGTFPQGNYEDLSSYVVKYSSNQESITKILDLILETINNNNNENEKLSELRDTLLPKLMNGEIDLDNIEI